METRRLNPAGLRSQFRLAKQALVLAENHDNLRCRDSSFVRLECGLKAFQALTNHMGGGSAAKSTSRQSFRKEVRIDRSAHLIILEAGSEDQFRLHSSRSIFRCRERGRHELAATRPVDSFETLMHIPGGVQRSSECLSLKSAHYAIDDLRIGMVEDGAGPSSSTSFMLLAEAVVTHRYPAATASWIALHPTLDEPPQTRIASPVG